MKVSKDLLTWLKKTPSLTTFRVNLLKYDTDSLINDIQLHLKERMLTNSEICVPKVYKIFDDTVAVECWPDSDEIIKERPEVIVDSFCGAAVLRGSHVFAPGIMGLPPDIPVNSMVNIYADITGGCKRGLKIKYDNENKLLVGYGILKQSRSDLFAKNSKPRGIGVETIMPLSRIPVIDNHIFPNGSCILQNLPSIICTKVLNPKCGETILDMCASPGNKTSHIAEIIQNKGLIIALDKTAAKVQKIKSTCDSLSITCVHAFLFDSTKAVIENDADLLNDKMVLEGPPFKSESFDRILLDAPCSALGQRPMIKDLLNNLAPYSPLQRKFFYPAVKLLKKSGQLIYSTCTITEDECESMVSWVLKTFPELTLVPAEPLLGGPGWKTPDLTESQRLMIQRFGPTQDEARIVDPIYNDTIGFFIAKFEKR